LGNVLKWRHNTFAAFAFKTKNIEAKKKNNLEREGINIIKTNLIVIQYTV